MNFLKYLKNYWYIKKNKLFDEIFYLKEYEDVRKADIDPLKHYLLFGIKEKRKPFENFNMDLYNLYSNPLLELKENCKFFCEEIKKDYVKPSLKKEPLVSIVILNRNGYEHLKILFDALKKHTLYSEYEIIVVDNASNDKSIELLKKEKDIKVIWNKKNESFSKANNDAVKVAKGELLLFLNNDIKPQRGWLCELVKEYLNNPKLGSAGSKLIYPFKNKFEYSCKIQHVGIAFRYEGDFYRPYNLGNAEEIGKYAIKEKRVALTAACLLVPRKIFKEVDGFDERYIYGYEDVDLGLKILKAGYDNIYVPTSILYHYEFGTQSKETNESIKKRRLNNIKIFKKKWFHYIKKNYWNEKINGGNLFSKDKLKIGFIVSNKGEGIAEGDYFSAKELGDEFKKFGWQVDYISMKHKEWYKKEHEFDIVIVMIDKYDVRKAKMNQKKVIFIAWTRNWFKRWVSFPWFKDYDFVFASSSIAVDFMKNYTNKEVVLFPIATSFHKRNKIVDKNFQSDYVFTGSYWNDPRDLIKYLNPKNIPFKFHLYGKNWEKIEKFKPYFKGFIDYKDIVKVYSNTKIVIDDANRVTKDFGSVNSRVFDALAMDVLVITNGVLGSKDLFDGKLPTYSSEQELKSLLEKYLTNKDERIKLVKELIEIVLESHTYEKRAKQFKNFLNDVFLKKSILIKIPVPKKEIKEEWGDYHFAMDLKESFEKLNIKIDLALLYEWEDKKDIFFDTVLVLRGLSKCKLNDYNLNIMWNISHPDKINIEEYKEYDRVYVASMIWSEELKEKYNLKNIETLLQCTNPEKFKPMEYEKDIDVLFVGNSRKVYRKIIKDLMKCNIEKYNVWIIGNNWESFIDKKFIKAKNISNKELYKYYNRAKIVLNDHWEDMKEKGFISNRLFDVSACKGFVISDYVKGLEQIFEDSIVTYEGVEDLEQKIKLYVTNKVERNEKAVKAYNIVINNHTFDDRAEKIFEFINAEI